MNIELEYAKTLTELLKTGIECENRTGITTLVKEHQFFEFPGNSLPALKGKKVNPRFSLVETIWMLLGRTDIAWLKERGVNYWDNWQDKKGTIGKSYGYQFRNFGGIDQLQDVIEQLKNDWQSRRIIINLFNPADLKDMTLPPCVHSYQFTATKDKETDLINVSLHVLARSNDAFLGVPYDFMNAYFILNLIVNYLNLESNKYVANKVYYTANNYHLYKNHIEAVIDYLRNIDENKYDNIGTEEIIEVHFPDCGERVTLDEYLGRMLDTKIDSYLSYKLIKAPIAI